MIGKAAYSMLTGKGIMATSAAARKTAGWVNLKVKARAAKEMRESIFKQTLPRRAISGLGWIGKKVLKGTFGTGIGRMAFGAGVGGLYGAMSGDGTSEGMRERMIGGALTGLAVGAATTKMFGRAAVGGGKRLFGLGAGRSITRSPVARMATGAGRMGLGTASFALNNPRLALTLAGTGVGLYGLSTTGGGLDQSSDDTARQAMQRGSSNINLSHVAHQNSTVGLVQGLHRGRHRG